MNYPHPTAGTPAPPVAKGAAAANDGEFPFDIFDEPLVEHVVAKPWQPPPLPPPPTDRKVVQTHGSGTARPDPEPRAIVETQRGQTFPKPDELKEPPTRHGNLTNLSDDQPPHVREEPVPERRSGSKGLLACGFVLFLLLGLFGGGAAFVTLFVLYFQPPTANTSPSVRADSRVFATDTNGVPTNPTPDPTTPTPPTTPQPTEPAGDPPLVVSASGPYKKIGDALAKASPNAVVTIKPGIYNEALTITTEVQLVGDGPAEKIILRSKGKPCLSISSRSRFSNLTFESVVGTDATAAVLVTAGTPRFEECRFTSADGECVKVGEDDPKPGAAKAEPSFKQCTMTRGAFGLVAASGVRVQLTDCSLEENETGVQLRDADGEFTGCRILRSKNRGVEVTGEQAHAILRTCEMNDTREGPGLDADQNGNVMLEKCTLRGNNKAGIRARKSKVTLVDCKVANNKVGGEEFWAVVSDGATVDASRNRRADLSGKAITTGANLLPPER